MTTATRIKASARTFAATLPHSGGADLLTRWRETWHHALAVYYRARIGWLPLPRLEAAGILVVWGLFLGGTALNLFTEDGPFTGKTFLNPEPARAESVGRRVHDKPPLEPFNRISIFENRFFSCMYGINHCQLPASSSTRTSLLIFPSINALMTGLSGSTSEIIKEKSSEFSASTISSFVGVSRTGS